MMSIAPLLLLLAPVLPQATGEGIAPGAGQAPARGAAKATAQGPIPLPTLREEYDSWRVRNRVEQVINTDIVTFGAIMRGVGVERQRYTIQTPEELNELMNRVAGQLSIQRLWVQAGQEMGIDQEMFQKSVDRLLAEEQESLGTLGHAQSLRRKGFDRKDEQAAASDNLYADWFRASVAGYAPGSNGRQVVDTFLRPGQLQAIYEQFPEVFAAPPTVQLQLLVVTTAQAGSLEDAEQIVADFRRDALAGEDFDTLCRDFSAIGSGVDGRGEPVSPDQLADPRHQAFVAGNPEVGSFSEVMPFALPENPGEVIGYQLVRLIARSALEPPKPFVDKEIQIKVNKLAQNVFRGRRLESAEGKLQRESFIWPPALGPGGNR
jgi:hypothetical protein